MSPYTLPFVELPAELQTQILKDLSQRDLAHLSRTCKSIRDCLIPYLYQSIDLSCHRSKKLSTIGHQEGEFAITCPLTFVKRKRLDLDDGVVKRQGLFIRSLLENTKLAILVQALTWTFLNKPHEVKPPFSRPHLSHGLYFHLGADDEPTWKAFSMMRRVKSVDLHWLRSYRETIPIPHGMFSSATSLCLGGQASRRFVKSILDSSNLTGLENLELHNLQQFSDSLPAVRPKDSDADKLKCKPSEQKVRAVNSQAAGIMHDHLGPVLRLTPPLRHLTVSTWSQCFTASDHDLLSLQLAILYQQWAALLRSVQSTLEQFSFEQGPALDHVSEELCSDHVRSGERLMDSLCAAHIVPTILDSSWPRLQRLEIRGFECWFEGMTASDSRVCRTSRYSDLREAIRAHLDVRTQVDIMDPPRRKFELV